MNEEFSEYDLDKLKDARDLLRIVHDYYYGDYGMRRMWSRLDTIINKLNELIRLNEEGRAKP